MKISLRVPSHTRSVFRSRGDAPLSRAGPALLLVAAPFWLGARNDLASFEVGIVLLLALTPLGLRALSLTANEVDEE